MNSCESESEWNRFGGRKMRTIEENYQRIKDDNRSFDIRFWQSQGHHAIFEAAWELIRDYYLIRGENADEFRLQRTVEHRFSRLAKPS